MIPEIPRAIKRGHENLCTDIKAVIAFGGDVGKQAKLLENTMLPHFQKEEDYALRPLGLLLALSEGSWEFDSEAAITMAETLQSRLSELNDDHKKVLKNLQGLKSAAEKEDNLFAKQFVKDLMLHIEVEDQVLYPSTILIGNYLKKMKAEN